MSRSFKHAPYHSMTCVGDREGYESAAKRSARKGTRRAQHATMGLCAELVDGATPLLRERSTVWAFPKDGKHRFDPASYPQGLRK